MDKAHEAAHIELLALYEAASWYHVESPDCYHMDFHCPMCEAIKRARAYLLKDRPDLTT